MVVHSLPCDLLFEFVEESVEAVGREEVREPAPAGAVGEALGEGDGAAEPAPLGLEGVGHRGAVGAADGDGAGAVEPEPLRGRVRVPGDKSISHRSLMLSALAVGESRVEGLLEGEDVLATAAAMRAMGATIDRDDDGVWRVSGVGVGGLLQPAGALDMGNSGTAARLLCGILASHDLFAVMTGDASLRRRPMRRVIDPLGATGAMILGTLVDELERREKRYGMATLCIDQADAVAAALDADLAFPRGAPHRAVQMVELRHLYAVEQQRSELALTVHEWLEKNRVGAANRRPSRAWKAPR